MEPRDFQNCWRQKFDLVFQSPETQSGRVEEIIRQEESLLKFADWDGWLVRDLAAKLWQTCQHTEGSEHLVFLSERERKVYKFTVPGQYGERFATPAEYLRRLDLCNQMAPRLAVRIVGIFEHGDGQFSIVSEMPYQRGIHPTPGQLEELLADRGWRRENRYANIMAHRHGETGLILKDTHPGNFKYWDGILVPIDVGIEWDGDQVGVHFD